MNKVNVLIISDTLDFGTDFICYGLEKKGTSYLRINRDRFREYNVTFVLNELIMHIEIKGKQFEVNRTDLKSVFFRAPIYLRDSMKSDMSSEDQLYRSQWSAFVRNLSVYEDVLWLNNPISTFKAENKFLQLKYAKELGFEIPESIASNNRSILPEGKLLIKSIDTAYFLEGSHEAFLYTTLVDENELNSSNLRSLPLMIQEYIGPKKDIRVTVIGNELFAVKIVKDHEGIVGDWRKQKGKLVYSQINLPDTISDYCLKITNMLGLKIAGIDLIESDGTYYFIEINPTGEWAWLITEGGLEIDTAICNCLTYYDRGELNA